MKKINTSVDTTIYRNHKKLFELIKNNKNVKDIAYNMSYKECYKNCIIYIDKEENNLIDIELKFGGNEQNYPEIIFILSSDSEKLKIKSSSFNQISYKEYIKFIESYQQMAMHILREINIAMV
jgi:hypothetical protein